ncbi:CdvA-like protein [Marine Group I thaumarchaeote]|uniref:CdvA-like protein n=1 Tax=Marine Group I thaumarchaeote TaxID=2511932 RepID=A0A7K4P1P5_9ARCH|nr:CdvA-like protein [Marine Group I thaumarchaeote]
MANDDIEIIGKNVKDMYGAFMGKVVGTITDIDGSIQSIGVDCSFQGLQQIQYEQIVVQNDAIIFIPKWRLDSQRLIREKQLTLRRLKALIDIVSENDHMKADAEIIHEKYKSKLVRLDETESEIKAKLEERATELEEESKSAKMLLFDAKVQCKSNEISETTFDTVKSCTNEVIERVSHELAEIKNVKSRIADLELEVQEMIAPSQPNVQESAVSYLETPESQQVVQTILPEAPIVSTPKSSEPIRAETLPIPESPTKSEVSAEFQEPPKQVTPETPKDNDNDWLARM